VHFPITIGVHRSRILDVAVLLVAVLTSAALLVYPGQTWVILGLLLFAWGLALRSWRLLTPEIAALRIERSGEIFVLRSGGGEFLSVEAEPGATVHPWLTAIRLRGEDGRYNWLLLTVDSANREDFRRLRSFLRWQARFSVAGDDA